MKIRSNKAELTMSANARLFRNEPIHFHAPEIGEGHGRLTIKQFRERFIHLKKVADSFGTIRTTLEAAVEGGSCSARNSTPGS